MYSCRDIILPVALGSEIYVAFRKLVLQKLIDYMGMLTVCFSRILFSPSRNSGTGANVISMCCFLFCILVGLGACLFQIQG
jgi:hypothetical protein